MASAPSRCAYPVAFKLQVASFAAEGGHGNRAAARHFAVSEANVRRWREQKRAGSFRATPRTAKKLGSGRKAFFPELEDALFQWVVAAHEAAGGGPAAAAALTTGAIAAKGRELAQRRGLAGFTGRPSWVRRFMRRKGLDVGRRAAAAAATTTTTTSSSRRWLPDAYEEKIYEFHRRIYKMRKKGDYALGDIVGMDETPVWLEMPCGGAGGAGGEKLRFSVVLSCCADGRKLEPLCIFKRKTVPKDAPCGGGVAVTAQQQGHCDEQVMKAWVSRCLMQRHAAAGAGGGAAGGAGGGLLLRRRSLLVMDMFSAHESVRGWLEEERVSVAIVPGGLGRVLQPVEIAVKGPFKDAVRAKWAAWMRRENAAVTAAGRVKRAGVPEVCAFVKEAWDEIPAEVIVKGFLKAGISNALDGSQDEELFSEPGDDDVDDDDSSWDDSGEEEEDEECDGFCAETDPAPPTHSDVDG